MAFTIKAKYLYLTKKSSTFYCPTYHILTVVQHKNVKMKKTLILLFAPLIWSCAQNQSSNEEVNKAITETKTVEDDQDQFSKFRREIVVTPNLASQNFIRLDSVYTFSVQNVPADIVGAQIIPGRIMRTASDTFEFLVRYPADSVELNISATMDDKQEDILVVKKKLKE